ncbi:hypothetical protein HDV00_005054 [Rhizophlyctis rosea]|nr:hypothetical protein HDV00_005054 [Rhizophlyctis rosea]
MLHSITVSPTPPLPLFKQTSSQTSFADLDLKYRRHSLLSTISRYIRTVYTNPETRKVFLFLLLNMSFTVVEFAYGWWTGSLGLTADAVHMLFDSTALILSLGASVVAKWDMDERFTYGFGRVETLTGFANALALFLASGNIIWEAVERMWDPMEIKTEELLVVSILGLLVNMGMFLHVLSDTLGSVGVIISTLLIQWYGWLWSDPLCSLFIAVMTIASVWPLLKETAAVLLQRVPYGLERELQGAFNMVLSIPGVIGMSHPHFWELCSNHYVGTVKVQVAEGANEQEVRFKVANVFREVGVRDVTVQVEKDGGVTY